MQVDALAGLDDVDWSAVSHAYGPATDVPDLLRALQVASTAEDALDALGASILHQDTYYPATTEAVPFLAALACDPRTPNRPALLAFLASIDGMRPGVTGDDLLGLRGQYLPPGLDLDAFEARARDTYRAASTAIRGCLDDADAAVRAAVPGVWRALAPLPADLAEALHRRLSIEHDAAVIGAIAGALADAGLLGEAERATVDGAPAVARFAVACSALQSDQPLDPRDLATICALWAECARGFAGLSGPRELLEGLLAKRQAAILPLLDELAAGPDPGSATEAIAGYRTLARLSRGATGAAVDGLVRLASRFAERPGSGAAHDSLPAALKEQLAGARTLTGAMRHLAAHRPDAAARERSARRALADALTELLVTDREGHARVADALLSLALAEPADLCRAAAEALLDAGDPRWVELAARAAATGTPVASILSLTLSATQRTGDAQALRDALDMVRDALRRDPAGNASFLWSLVDLPDAAVAPLLPEVVAALPFAARPACDLLARWKRPETATALRAALADADTEARPWLHAALAAVTGEAGELDHGWTAQPRFFDAHGYLARWAALPTPLFREACHSLLTGTVAPGTARHDQLLACRLMLPVDGLPGIWPTLRAIVDAGEPPMREAVALAVAALAQAPDAGRRGDLVALLDDIRSNGRRGLLGNLLEAPAEAAAGLHALGAGAPTALADTCLRTLRNAAGARLLAIRPDRACTLLIALARDDDGIRDAARACLAEVLAADARVPSSRGSNAHVASDEAFQATLRGTAAALAG